MKKRRSKEKKLNVLNEDFALRMHEFSKNVNNDHDDRFSKTNYWKRV